MIAHESLRRLDFAVEHLRWLEPGATGAATCLVAPGRAAQPLVYTKQCIYIKWG
jgi:hypothetical protein